MPKNWIEEAMDLGKKKKDEQQTNARFALEQKVDIEKKKRVAKQNAMEYTRRVVSEHFDQIFRELRSHRYGIQKTFSTTSLRAHNLNQIGILLNSNNFTFVDQVGHTIGTNEDGQEVITDCTALCVDVLRLNLPFFFIPVLDSLTYQTIAVVVFHGGEVYLLRPNSSSEALQLAFKTYVAEVIQKFESY